MVPVLASAQRYNFTLDFLFLFWSFDDCFGQFLQQSATLLDVLWFYRVGLFAACAVHLLQEFAHIEVVIFVSYKFLFVYAVGHQAVLASQMTAFDGVDFEGERRASTGVVVDFCFNSIGVAIF